MDSFKHIIMV